MRGILAFLDLQTLKPCVVLGKFSFQTTVTPGVMPKTSLTGSLSKLVASITFAATGLYTIQMVAGFGFSPANPPLLIVNSACADLTGVNAFTVQQVGVATNSQGLGMSFVLQCLNAPTTAFSPPNTVGNRINVSIEGVNETAV